MAEQWAAKAPGAVYRYTWAPPLADGDGLATATLAVSSGDAVINSQSVVDDELAAFISGGTAGTVTVFTATGTSDDGEGFSETIYLAIRSSANAFTYTAQDICSFALRKIIGNGETAQSAELDDALERLNDMLAVWQIDGLDIGIAGKLVTATVLKVPDPYIQAVKYNLRVLCHEHYGVPLSAFDIDMAARSRMLVGNALFGLADLAMPSTLSYPAVTD